MNRTEQLLSEDQIDFLREMMNIGAGHATTAMMQMLKCRVNTTVPEVSTVPTGRLSPIVSDSSLPVTAAKIDMVGSVTGHAFFIVPQQYMSILTGLAEQANLGGVVQSTGPAPSTIKSATHIRFSNDISASILAEIANIIVGVYMTAIHDFCGLNIFHTVPIVATDMILSLLDETLARMSYQVQAAILVKNEFRVETKRLATYLLIIPSSESIKTLVGSIEQARVLCER